LIIWDDIVYLLFVKVHFSRKCAERPFEHVMSIIKLVPWEEMNSLCYKQCYELFDMALDAILSHLPKNHPNIGPILFERMIDTGLKCIKPIDESNIQKLRSLRENMPKLLKSRKSSSDHNWSSSSNSLTHGKCEKENTNKLDMRLSEEEPSLTKMEEYKKKIKHLELHVKELESLLLVMKLTREES
jgi:hypothetical protein